MCSSDLGIKKLKLLAERPAGLVIVVLDRRLTCCSFATPVARTTRARERARERGGGRRPNEGKRAGGVPAGGGGQACGPAGGLLAGGSAHCVQGIVPQLYRILGSVDVLGNPTALSSEIGSGLAAIVSEIGRAHA